MKIVIIIIFCLLILPPSWSRASSDRELRPTNVELNFSHRECLLKIESNKEGILSRFLIKLENAVLIIPPEELIFEDKKVDLTGIKVFETVATPNGSEKLTKLKSFRVFIPCGNLVYTNVENKVIVYSTNAVVFEFVEGTFVSRHRAVSKGIETGKWKIFQKIPGEKENFIEEVSSLTNPLGSDLVVLK